MDWDFAVRRRHANTGLHCLKMEHRAIERYVKLEKVGEGSYGVVYKARDSSTGNIVALKKIRLQTDDEGVPPTAVREISILKQLEHDNIVQLLDIEFSQEKLHLIFEYIEEDLKKYLNKAKPLPQAEVRRMTRQLIAGVHYCHTHRVLHRDLKPQNILVDAHGTLRIADFGLARAFGLPLRTLTHEIVTLWYRAPEVLLGVKCYSLGVDMWSIGCIMAELSAARPLFLGDSEIDQLFKIFQVLGTPNENNFPGVSLLKDFTLSFPKWRGVPLHSVVPMLDPLGQDLLAQLIMYDPAKRISAKEALLHPYFSGNVN